MFYSLDSIYVMFVLSDTGSMLGDSKCSYNTSVVDFKSHTEALIWQVG